MERSNLDPIIAQRNFPKVSFFLSPKSKISGELTVKENHNEAHLHRTVTSLPEEECAAIDKTQRALQVQVDRAAAQLYCVGFLQSAAAHAPPPAACEIQHSCCCIPHQKHAIIQE